MTKINITIPNLIAAMKTAGFVTKLDLKGSEARIIKKVVRNDNKNKREIMLNMSKLALTTPTRKEFEKLRERVEGVHN